MQLSCFKIINIYSRITTTKDEEYQNLTIKFYYQKTNCVIGLFLTKLKNPFNFRLIEINLLRQSIQVIYILINYFK